MQRPRFGALTIKESVTFSKGIPRKYVCRLQLYAVQRVKELLAERGDFHARLKVYLIGGSRNELDAARVQQLRRLSEELGIADSIEFAVNAPFEEVLRMVGCSVAGLHSMVDEHFGIGIVEYQAAGCVPVAHDSGTHGVSNSA
jgi:glycosyltransferase involved in cell wall biosynthesis